MDYNPILDTDSYKLSHEYLYPNDLTKVYSYAESRGGKYPATLQFGLQAFVKRLVENPVTMAHIEEAKDFAFGHGLPFNADHWQLIVDHHGGYLPLEIKAAPEGLLIPTSNALVTVVNTDRVVPALTSNRETPLLRQVWYAQTAATRLFYMKQRIATEFEGTAEDGVKNPALDFALLDFMSRGATSYQANEIAGGAYLAFFKGSDSMPAVRWTNHYYDSPMSGFSVIASEHSVTTAWGEGRDRELTRMRQAIAATPEGGILSDVIDTWNCFTTAMYWAELKDELRAKNITLVLRPDSGKISDVLPTLIGAVRTAWGTRANSKGFDVFDGVKILWGDGINELTCIEAFKIARSLGVSAESIMVGSGGGIAQVGIDRDTCKFAFKASAIERQDGPTFNWEAVSKEPVTDPGKRSKRGRFKLHFDRDEGYSTIPFTDERSDVLRTIYKNGELFNMESIDTIRERVNSQLF